jgi:hypothetical protein
MSTWGLEAWAQPEPPDAYPAPPSAVPAPPSHQPPPPPSGQPGYQPAYPAYPAPPIARRPSNRVTQRVAIYGELLGKGLLYGVGADVNFTKWLGVGTTFSYYQLPGDDLTAGIFAPYLAMYAGGFSSAFVAHAGPVILFGREGDWWGFDRIVLGQASVGYEYRSGFLFRVMATFFFHEDFVLPMWPGFSFGGAF